MSFNFSYLGDWPGINMTPVRESLWDSNYHPTHGSWTDESNVETEIPLNSLNNSCVRFFIVMFHFMQYSVLFLSFLSFCYL